MKAEICEIPVINSACRQYRNQSYKVQRSGLFFTLCFLDWPTSFFQISNNPILVRKGSTTDELLRYMIHNEWQATFLKALIKKNAKESSVTLPICEE